MSSSLHLMPQHMTRRRRCVYGVKEVAKKKLENTSRSYGGAFLHFRDNEVVVVVVGRFVG